MSILEVLTILNGNMRVDTRSRNIKSFFMLSPP